MNLKEKFEKLRKLVFDSTTPAAKAYTLQDGTPVSISDLSNGGDVLISGAPAKAGDYTLNDGTTITVGADGKISAVKMATPMHPDTTQMPNGAPETIAPTKYEILPPTKYDTVPPSKLAPAKYDDPTVTSPDPVIDNLMDGTIISYTTLAPGGVIKDASGAPLKAGIYTLDDNTQVTVGDNGAITAIVPGNIPDYDEAMRTAAGRANFARIFNEKFATAAGDEKLQNLATCVSALMNYAFGWDIKYQNDEAQKQAAITALKTSFNKQLQDANTIIQAQQKTMVSMFDFMKELAEMPDEPLPGENKAKFAFSKAASKAEKFSKYAESLASLK